MTTDTHSPKRLWLHALLFVLTFLSAVISQISLDREETFITLIHHLVQNPWRLLEGMPFAIALMTILLAHEMGHYITAKKFDVDQSLPYFIPAPTLFGTLGAVIFMRSQPPHRRALLHVAVNGPYAGLIFAIPLAAWGLAHSMPIVPETLGNGPYLWFGSSLLFKVLEKLFSPNGSDVVLHPIAFAAWVGLFVTSLNLIPVGQLDGGHVAYALFGRFHKVLSQATVFALLGFGIIMGLDSDRGWVWIFWAIMLLFVLGTKHPPVVDEMIPLSRAERINGWVALLTFIVTFVPVPMEFVNSGFDNPVPPNHPLPQTETIEGEEFNF